MSANEGSSDAQVVRTASDAADAEADKRVAQENTANDGDDNDGAVTGEVRQQQQQQYSGNGADKEPIQQDGDTAQTATGTSETASDGGTGDGDGRGDTFRASTSPLEAGTHEPSLPDEVTAAVPHEVQENPAAAVAAAGSEDVPQLGRPTGAAIGPEHTESGDALPGKAATSSGRRSNASNSSGADQLAEQKTEARDAHKDKGNSDSGASTPKIVITSPSDDEGEPQMVEFDRSRFGSSVGEWLTGPVSDTLIRGFPAGLVVVLLLALCELLATSLMYVENDEHGIVKTSRNETDDSKKIKDSHIVVFFVVVAIDIVVFITCSAYLLIRMYCSFRQVAFVNFTRIALLIYAVFYSLIGVYAIYFAAMKLSVVDRTKRQIYFYEILLVAGIIGILEAVALLIAGLAACVKYNHEMTQDLYSRIIDEEEPHQRLQQETGKRTSDVGTGSLPETSSADADASTAEGKSQLGTPASGQ